MRDVPVLETEGLTIGFKRRRQPPRILAEGINIKLPAGQFTCLLGPNGTGKSTLIRTLAGMQTALAGTVYLTGSPLPTLSPKEVAKKVSLVLTQPISVGMMPVISFVALGRHPYTNWMGRLKERDKEAVWRAIEWVDIQHLVHRPVGELSDGEKQKVKIARALAQDPTIMILDEATAFLDMPRRVELMHLLRRLAHESGRAILLSTHDLDLALRWASHLWLLPPGGPLREGIPEDLVLEDAFASTFGGGEIRFDKREGSFTATHRPRGAVVLHGEGIPFIWTRRALERAGYEVQTDGRANPSVHVRSAEGRPVWHLSGLSGQDEISYQSLERLLEALDKRFGQGGRETYDG